VDATLALLPSPLLGPAVWQPVAARLRQRGRAVLEVEQPRDAPRTPSDVTHHLLRELPEEGPLVLVPHSNAGLFVPSLVERRDVRRVVFVDAGLPPSAGQVPLAPPQFYDFLTGLADASGLLPPWTQWWGTDISDLFPDVPVRRAVEREQHRLPLSYFTGTLEVADGWNRTEGGYLSFGDTYAEERRRAADRGWPVRTLEGGHLHLLVEPDTVATAIEELATG
jgi:hypothetical protein